MDLEDNKEQEIIEIELLRPFSLIYFNFFASLKGEYSKDIFVEDNLTGTRKATIHEKLKAKIKLAST